MIIQQFCCNDCFEDRVYSNSIVLLGNNLSITEILPMLMYKLIHEKHYVNIENGTQLNPAQWNTQIAHTSNIYGFSIWFQITLLSLHNNSWALSLSKCTSTSKLQVFQKVRCHIYYTNYVFLDNLACVSYQFLLSS